MRIIRILCILFVTISSVCLTSCQKEGIPPTIQKQKTLFMYLPWSTNLTDYFYNNIADMEEAISHTGLDKERVIVFLSTSASEAEMFEIVYENGSCHRQILKEYTNPSFTTQTGLTAILNDMKSFAPALKYAMIIGCHGMGWLPVEQSPGRTTTDFTYHWEYTDVPQTRFFGGLTTEYQTDVTTLSQSLSNSGLKMDYILFDDCYMSSLEVAYDLRHVTDYLIACPTEIMVYGMPYSTMGEYLLAEKPDYAAICQAFYEFYSNYQYPYGTIAVTDCSRLDELAFLMKDMHSRYSLDTLQTASIQRMDGYSPVIFYDFGDYVRILCGNDSELYGRFTTLMEKIVPFKAHTPKFYTASRGPIIVEQYSGITTSAPSLSSKARTYPQTSWYQATH
jgi:hypothetical protein